MIYSAFYLYLTLAYWESKMDLQMEFSGSNSLAARCLREIVKMKKREKKNEKERIETKLEEEQNVVSEKNTSKFGKIVREIFVNVLGGVLTTAILFTGSLASGIYSDIKSIPNMATKEDIADMLTLEDIKDMATAEDIKDIVTQKDLTVLSNQIEGIDKKYDNINKKYDEMNRSIGVIQGRLGVIVEPNADFVNMINQTYESYDSVYDGAQKNVWIDLKQEVGKDLITGDTYKAEDLENDTIILSYVDKNNDEVFFKGSFNEDNQWNGNCIINKYSDGNLNYIMNANYEEGKLVNYNQVFTYVNTADIEVWAISSRTVDGSGNAGHTLTYYKEKEWKKNFENQYLKAENIINEEYFYNIMDLKIEGYYNGYTSDGLFNDTSEEAYMIKYTSDGYVRMLYSGGFAAGQPHEMDRNALAIAWGHDEKNYYYYVGKIDDLSKIGDQWIKTSVDEVKSMIKNLNIDAMEQLNWYDDVA